MRLAGEAWAAYGVICFIFSKFFGGMGMAYEVTASRRRPQRFEDLAGQEFVAETLKNSIRTGHIAHAYLFAGPRGCGKTSTARILAKALNCQSEPNPVFTPCGSCESCRAITNSSGIDVIEIDGASNTSVNDVRQIKDEVLFPPNTSRYKIYIIDEVHMLSTSAFNALLKTIEEPPPYVIFIFATTELQKVPATIKSRCQQYNFRLVGAEKLKSLLSDAAEELGMSADDAALYWIARESGGSVRDSYTLFDQVAAFSDGQITYEKIRDKLGLVGIDRLNVLFESCAAGNAEAAVGHIDAFLDAGVSIEQLIANAAEYIRSLLLIKNGITREALLGQPLETFSAAVLASWNAVQTERALSLFLQLHRDMRYSISPRYELELAFSRLCWLTQYVSPAEVKAAVDAARNLLLQSGGTNVHAASGTGEEAGVRPLTASAAPPETNAMPRNAAGQTSSPQEAPPRSSVPPGMPQFSALSGMQHSEPAAIHSSERAAPSIPQQQFSAQPAQSSAQQERRTEPPAAEQSALHAPQPSVPAFSSTAANAAEASASSEPHSSSSASASSEIPDSYPDEYPDSDADGKAAASAPEVMAYADTSVWTHGTEGDIHESDVAFTAPDGSRITMGKLYGAVIAELAVDNASLGAALMRTGCWNLNGSVISATIETEYQKSFIDREKSRILAIIDRYCHASMQLEVTVEPTKTPERPVELPLQVKILCNSFKGSIL